MLSTKKKTELTKAQKDEKISGYRVFHKELLDYQSAKDTDFNVKTVFMNKGQRIVGLFPNEFTKPNGFYFEIVNSELDPVDPERTVYTVQNRENFEDIYDLLQWGQYAVPIEELTVVKLPRKSATSYSAEKLNIESVETKDDDHFSKMTIRDLAAIMWQEPVSDKHWLNDLVNGIKAKIN